MEQGSSCYSGPTSRKWLELSRDKTLKVRPQWPAAFSQVPPPRAASGSWSFYLGHSIQHEYMGTFQIQAGMRLHFEHSIDLTDEIIDQEVESWRCKASFVGSLSNQLLSLKAFTGAWLKDLPPPLRKFQGVLGAQYQDLGMKTKLTFLVHHSITQGKGIHGRVS